MKAVLINGLGSSVTFTLLNDSNLFLKQLYEVIGCKFVTCIDVKVKPGSYVSIWSDDEALGNLDNKFFTEFNDKELFIVGNFVITGTADDEGNTTAIPDDIDLNQLIKQQGILRTKAS